jgi:hypothetical protein
MDFVEPNALNRTGLAVGKDHGLADKLSVGSLELTEDRACVLLHGWHDGVHKSGGSSGVGLSLKGVEVVTNARQRYVGCGAARHGIADQDRGSSDAILPHVCNNMGLGGVVSKRTAPYHAGLLRRDGPARLTARVIRPE